MPEFSQCKECKEPKGRGKQYLAFFFFFKILVLTFVHVQVCVSMSYMACTPVPVGVRVLQAAALSLQPSQSSYKRENFLYLLHAFCFESCVRCGVADINSPAFFVVRRQSSLPPRPNPQHVVINQSHSIVAKSRELNPPPKERAMLFSQTLLPLMAIIFPGSHAFVSI